MGFGDYVKMLHHSMNEHGTPIPDAQTFHRESTGVRNGHSQVVVKAIHKDVPIEVREEVVHENGNGRFLAGYGPVLIIFSLCQGDPIESKWSRSSKRKFPLQVRTVQVKVLR